MSSLKQTVVVVDDDPDFVSVMRLVLETDGFWEVIDTFDSLESFFTSALNPETKIPNLLVVDIFASTAEATATVPITGFQVALSLRDLGFQFGTLIISSMDSPSLLRLVRDRYKDGWAYLVKSADLSSEDILRAAREALLP